MNICVYGASSSIIDDKYINAGEKLGEIIAKRGHGLVYGGGANGMMGAVARGVNKQNGKIIGVSPSFFKVDGVLYDQCTEFVYTENMRDRKAVMEERSDAFIVTPGSVGTFDEFFEILTLKQLCKHSKPIAVFNILNYFDPMIDMLKQTVKQKFMKEKSLDLFFVSENPNDILSYIEKYSPENTRLEEFKHVR